MFQLPLKERRLEEGCSQWMWVDAAGRVWTGWMSGGRRVNGEWLGSRVFEEECWEEGCSSLLCRKGVGRKGVPACFEGRVYTSFDVTSALTTKHVKGGLECKTSAEAKHYRTKNKPEGSTFR